MNNLNWYWIYVPYLDVSDVHEDSALKAGYDKVVFKSEADKVIAELKESVKMHDFFWEGCGFAKRGFKNSIAVNEAFDNLEAEHHKLKQALWLARAERAHVTTLYWNVYCYQNNCLYFRDFMPENCNPFRSLPKKTAMEWSDLWESIETKCRSKAEG